jgi:hypothetical protein
MQISRHLLLTCAVAACLIPTLVHAADNEAQIRARQALEEKMNQIGSQPPPSVPTNPAPAMSRPKAAPVKPASPVVTAPPNSTRVESQPAPINIATPSNDAATRQKLEDALNQASPKPQSPVQQPRQPAVVTAPRSAPVPSRPAPSYISTPSNDDAMNQKLEEAVRQKMQQTPPEPTAPAVVTQKPARPMKPAPAPAQTGTPTWGPAPAPSATANYAPLPKSNPNAVRPTLPDQPTSPPTLTPMMGNNQYVAPTMALPTLTGPSTGLSAAKEQKLNELLNQYRADQITPQQYHEQRAKILAEP